MVPNDPSSDSDPQTAVEPRQFSTAASAACPCPCSAHPCVSPPHNPKPAPKRLHLNWETDGKGVVGGGVLPHQFPRLIRSSLPLWKSSVDSCWPVSLVVCARRKNSEINGEVCLSQGRGSRRKIQRAVPPKCIHMGAFGKYRQVFQVLFNVFVLLFHVLKDIWSQNSPPGDQA